MRGLDEFGLIRLLTNREHISRSDQHRDVIVGIGDDAAVVTLTSGCQLVMACDTMVENVHWTDKTMTYNDIGFKAMASNISDMAAMGAMPRYALVALSVPGHISVEDLQMLYQGMYACADQFTTIVVGGDTTSTKAGMTVSITLVGEVEANQALLRSYARKGDIVFVTGALGLSAAGLHYLLHSENGAVKDSSESVDMMKLISQHQRPLPQVRAARILVEAGIAAALNDISDGLANETWEIAEASGCGLLLEQASIVVEPNLAQYARLCGQDPWEWILYGGEDYQLVGTIPEKDVERIRDCYIREGLTFACIGRVVDDFVGVRLVAANGSSQDIMKRGYNHFKE